MVYYFLLVFTDDDLLKEGRLIDPRETSLPVCGEVTKEAKEREMISFN